MDSCQRTEYWDSAFGLLKDSERLIDVANPRLSPVGFSMPLGKGSASMEEGDKKPLRAGTNADV